MDRSHQLVSITSIGPKSLAIVWAASWTVVEVRREIPLFIYTQRSTPRPRDKSRLAHSAIATSSGHIWLAF